GQRQEDVACDHRVTLPHRVCRTDVQERATGGLDGVAAPNPERVPTPIYHRHPYRAIRDHGAGGQAQLKGHEGIDVSGRHRQRDFGPRRHWPQEYFERIPEQPHEPLSSKASAMALYWSAPWRLRVAVRTTKPGASTTHIGTGNTTAPEGPSPSVCPIVSAGAV